VVVWITLNVTISCPNKLNHFKDEKKEEVAYNKLFLPKGRVELQLSAGL